MSDRFQDGLKYLDSNNPNLFNPKRCYEYYSQLLNEGLEYSKVILAVILCEGIGVEKDLALADKYFDDVRQFANTEVVDWINFYVSQRNHNQLYRSLCELCKKIVLEDYI